MKSEPRVSIIITNYNYGRFLPDALDSALGQTYPEVEVIVVDDGSTDESRQVIAGYGNRIIPVLKKNGGMASAFNAGLAVGRGEVVIFLDADDLLMPTAVERALDCFVESEVAQVHWPLWVADAHRRRTGGVIPGRELVEGDLRERVISLGPHSHGGSPTSGNAWSRRLLERVCPMPERPFRRGAESYFKTLAPIYGLVKRLTEPQGICRVHGANYFRGKTVYWRVRRSMSRHARLCGVLAKHLRAMGVDVDTESWKERSEAIRERHRQHMLLRDLHARVPPGAAFVMVDQGQWTCETMRGTSAGVLPRRRDLPFLGAEGQPWSPPSDDESALRELERLRQAGAGYIAFSWNCFWWLEHYADFARHLRSRYECLVRNQNLVLFDLGPGSQLSRRLRVVRSGSATRRSQTE